MSPITSEKICFTSNPPAGWVDDTYFTGGDRNTIYSNAPNLTGVGHAAPVSVYQHPLSTTGSNSLIGVLTNRTPSEIHQLIFHFYSEADYFATTLRGANNRILGRLTTYFQQFKVLTKEIYVLSEPNGDIPIQFRDFFGNRQAVCGIECKLIGVPVENVKTEVDCFGDSITEGWANLSTSYPQHLADLLNADLWHFDDVRNTAQSNLIRVRNLGFSATYLSDTISDADNHFVNYADANLNRKIAVIWSGSNNIVNGFSEQAIKDLITTLASNARASGYETVVPTFLPRIDCTGGQETIRQNLNTWIVANTDGKADATVDLRGFTQLNNPSDTTKFYDGIHPTDLGNQLIASQIQPIVSGQLTNTREYECVVDSITNGHGDNDGTNHSIEPSTQSYVHFLAVSRNANSWKAAPSNDYVQPTGYLIPYDAAKLEEFRNYGVENRQLLTYNNTDFANEILPRLGQANELFQIMLGGINDIGAGATANDVYSRWQINAGNCSANGVKLIQLSLLPVQNQTYDPTRQAANALLRANHSFTYRFIDVARNVAFKIADTNLFQASERTAGTAVHLSVAGKQKLAELVNQGLNGAILIPVITTTSLANATQNSAYDSGLIGATDGTGANTWEFEGTLPTGITFNATTGKFAGMPTQNGTFNNLVVRRIGADGWYDEKVFSLTVTAAGGGSQTFTDDFNRANGAIGNNWQAIVSGGFSVPTGNIGSNELVVTGGSSFHGFVRPDLIIEGSSEIELVSTLGNGLAPLVRLQTNDDCYLAYAALGTAGYTRIYKSSNGSAAPVSSVFNYALAVGDKLKLTAQGNVIIFSYIRGGVETEIGRYTDTTNPILTAGKFGFAADATTITLDNYKLINNAATTPVNTKRIKLSWGVADNFPTGYKIQKTVNAVTEIIDVGNVLEYFDTNLTEGEVINYTVAAYKGSVLGQYTNAIQKTFTNN